MGKQKNDILHTFYVVRALKFVTLYKQMKSLIINLIIY